MTIVEEVRMELGESTSMLGTNFWPADEVYNAINAALVAAYIDVNEDTALGTAIITASNEFVGLPHTVVMVPKRVVGAQGEIFPTTITDIEAYKSYYSYALSDITNPTAPRWIAPYGFEQVRTFPLSDDDYEYDVYGVAWPPEVSGSSLDITVPHELREAVKCLTVAFLVDDYYHDLCELKYMEYTQHISAHLRALRNKRGRVPMALKPSGPFDRARSGSINLGRRFRGI